MASKDKFKKLQQGGGVPGSFQDMVTQATTVAAIEKQAEQPAVHPATPAEPAALPQPPSLAPDAQRFIRLPNPQIPFSEYNLVSRYCESFTNMTRQDFMELAIIEKLHGEGLMPDDDYEARQTEIRNRLPRGHRKGTKTQMSK